MKTDELSMPEFLQGITDISKNIGVADFEQTLFSFLNTLLGIDHFVVFTYSDEAGTGHLFTRSIMPAAEAEELARDYVDEYHSRDPLFSQLQAAKDDRPLHPRMTEEYDPAYRAHFFTEHDLVDKISLTRKVDEGAIYCNFYRIGDSGQFSSTEKERFNTILPLITNLIACHFKILRLQGKGKSGDAPSARSLVHSVISRKVEPFDRLTARESEVCERILVGFTSTGIGLDLGIAESSVNTYRRRAYEKLAIATQNELFSLCISALNRFKH